MPRGKKSIKGSEQETHTHIVVRVDRFKVRSSAGINHHAREPRYAYHDPADEFLYQFQTHLDIAGTVLDPQDRAGDAFGLTVHAESSPASGIFDRLKDVRLLDEHNAPRYQTYRGRDYPLYWAPSGLGMIYKARGEKRWSAALFAAPCFVSDWLVLLGDGRNLFLAIHECKIQRQRWMQDVALQTTDPWVD